MKSGIVRGREAKEGQRQVGSLSGGPYGFRVCRWSRVSSPPLQSSGWKPMSDRGSGSAADVRVPAHAHAPCAMPCVLCPVCVYVCVCVSVCLSVCLSWCLCAVLCVRLCAAR